MRFMLVFGLLTFSTLSMAQTSLDKVIDSITEYDSKTGSGTYIKNGKTLKQQALCYVAVNNIDSWTSDYTVTADLFEITVGSKRLGTDLQSWDFSKGMSTSGSGSVKYARAFEGRNKCNYSLAIEVNKKNSSITFYEAKACKNGVVTNESLNCQF